MRKMLYASQLPVSFSCLHFKRSPFLSVCVLLRESDFIMCFNEANKKLQSWDSSFPFACFSLSLSELHCDIGYMAGYIDLLCFTSCLTKLPAVKSCFTKTFVPMFSLAGSTRGLIFVGLGFWCVCHTSFCFLVFSKWWKLPEWQLVGLYTYKRNNMHNASIPLLLTSGSQEYFRDVKWMYWWT